MRRTPWINAEPYRWRNPDNGMISRYGDDHGCFRIQHGLVTLCCIVSGGDREIPWEHVSVHARVGTLMKTPTWAEMCAVKGFFWDDDEVVMQLHPAKKDYVNIHPHVLHLWKPLAPVEIPLPPKIAV